jgi:hypothetical protein
MKIYLKRWSNGGILRLLDLALHFHKRRKFLIICGFIWVLRSELARVIVVIASMILYALLLISVFEHICRLPFISVYLMWRNTLYFSLHMDEKLNSSLTSSFRSNCGPRVDSASKRNEYQAYLLGLKTDVA